PPGFGAGLLDRAVQRAGSIPTDRQTGPRPGGALPAVRPGVRPGGRVHSIRRMPLARARPELRPAPRSWGRIGASAATPRRTRRSGAEWHGLAPAACETASRVLA